MMGTERRVLLKSTIEAFGKNAQIMMAIEEMSELTKELCKTFRDDNVFKESNTNEILEEIADCKIVLDQMEIIFGSARHWELTKLRRLEKILTEAGQSDKKKTSESKAQRRIIEEGFAHCPNCLEQLMGPYCHECGQLTY